MNFTRGGSILLLDDVLSELDRDKRARLMEFLRGVSSQIFLTSTEFEESLRGLRIPQAQTQQGSCGANRRVVCDR